MDIEKKTVSKAQQRATDKYVKAHYDRFNLKLPKGYKDSIQKLADAQGESVNAYIKGAIDRRMDAGN